MRTEIKTINSVELRTDSNQSIWKLDTKDRDEDFVDGLLYGSLFLLQQNPGHHIAITYSKWKDDRLYEKQIRTVEEIDDLGSVLAQLHKTIGSVKINTRMSDVYQILLRDVTRQDQVNIAFVNLEFFQGLFTILDLIKMPYEKVLLHKPVMYTYIAEPYYARKLYNFDIQGLNLPNIEDIVRK